MIALSYGLTYIWGTVGIILICKYLPRWWGIDAKAAAKKYEEEKGVPNVDDVGLTGYRPLALRAYRLTNNEIAGQTVRQFLSKHPEYKIVNVARGEELSARRRPGAAEGRRDRPRRAARGDDLEPGADRPRGAGREGAQRADRPGGDPGHQQGDGGQGAEGPAQHAARRPDRAAPHRARRRHHPDGPQHQARALRRAVRRRRQGRRSTGRPRSSARSHARAPPPTCSRSPSA